MKYLKHNQPFQLESGAILDSIQIAYTTYGRLDKNRANVVWVCHALTANADPIDWWSGLVGDGQLIDPNKHFIICANMLGSCYGSTGAKSKKPGTDEAYKAQFPFVSIRDMVQAHQLLARHLGIDKIQLIIGGSMGGQQALEWSIMEPERFQKMCLLASNAQHSPWGIAFNEAQRMAIEADLQKHPDSPEAGRKGLEAARAIAMLSYRHYSAYKETQMDADNEKLDDFKASSYQRYQGNKLWKRFDVYAYLSLSKSMDSHNVGRQRGSTEAALGKVKAETLVIGISSDLLFPLEEQQFLASNIPNAYFEVIDSQYGHDGFLVESEAITEVLGPFLEGKLKPSNTKVVALNRQSGRAALPGSEQF